VDGEYNKARSTYDGIIAVHNKENVGDRDTALGSPDKLDLHIAV
jgi:hypothetical protein